MNNIIQAFKQRLPRVFMVALIAMLLGLPALGFAEESDTTSSSDTTVEYVKPKEDDKDSTPKRPPFSTFSKSSSWSDGG